MTSVGLNDEAPQQHAGSRRVRLHPDTSHRLSVRWDTGMFELFVDGVGITRARLGAGALASPSPLAKLFVWVFARPTRSMFNQFEFRPLVSPVQMTARLTCRICNREHPISLPRWSVCSFCDTWVCTTHVGQQPTGLCPCCPNQLLDYIGGSAGADPYVTAVNYFDERQQFEGTTEKNACVALKLFRKHESFLIANPLALQLLPDPRCRQELSKRTWEPLLFRARTIIDLLEQRKHVLLFRFLHAVANDRLKVHEALTGLPRPIGFHGTEDDWEQLALAHAVRLQ